MSPDIPIYEETFEWCAYGPNQDIYRVAHTHAIYLACELGLSVIFCTFEYNRRAHSVNVTYWMKPLEEGYERSK